MRGQLLGLVLGEVFVLVAEGVGGFGSGGDDLVGRELAAIGDRCLALRLVARLGRQVFDLADDRLAAKDLAEDDVFAVQVWGRYGGDEELGAIGACRSSRDG